MAPAAAIPFPYGHDPFLLLQHALASRWLDPVMMGASWACEGWVLVPLAIAVAFLAGHPRRNPWAALPIALFAVLAADGALVQLLKHLLRLPRPLAVLGPHDVRVLLAPLHSLSMPSGHASAPAAAAAIQLGRRRRATGVALAVLATVGGVSRVYVGAHWALDVVVGWITGAAVGIAGVNVARAFEARRARASSAAPGAAHPRHGDEAEAGAGVGGSQR